MQPPLEISHIDGGYSKLAVRESSQAERGSGAVHSKRIEIITPSVEPQAGARTTFRVPQKKTGRQMPPR